MLRRTLLTGFAGLLATSPLIAACSSGGSKSTRTPASNDPTRTDIMARLGQVGSFKTLTQLLKAADLADDLARPGSFLLFAPDDNAFGASLGQGVLVSLRRPQNKATLVRLLKHHLVANLTPQEAQKARSLRSMAGTELKYDRRGQQLEVNGANVVKANIRASNGIIHIIDKVLMPPRA